MYQLPERSHYTWRTWFTFLVPSLIGVFLFMTPISTSQGMTIPIAVMAKAVQAMMLGSAQAIITLIICITGVISVITKVFKPAAIC
ncbi:MAG: YjiH family protein, partial [Pseudoalteromonas distincta]